MNNNNGVKTKALSIQIQSLNDTFADHIQRLASNPDTLTVSWKSAVEDYLSYVRMLKHTYNPDEGYIYSWGTGDCAQLGHGMNKDGFGLKIHGQNKSKHLKFQTWSVYQLVESIMSC